MQGHKYTCINPPSPCFCSTTTQCGPGQPYSSGFWITHNDTLHSVGLHSALRRDLFLTKPNTHMRQTTMPPAGFEPAIPASGRPQTFALDRSAIFLVLRCTLFIHIHYILYIVKSLIVVTNNIFYGIFTIKYYR